MQLSIDTWDGNHINDGVLYEAFFPEGTVLLSAEGKPSLVERTHFSPVYTYTGRSERLIPIKIKLLGTIAEQIDTIKRWFDTFDDSGLKTLVVHNAIGWNRQWYIEAKAFSVAAIDGQVVTINLLVPDPIWKASLETVDSWTITSTGATNVVTTGGNQDAYPVYSLVPTDAKSGGTVRYRNFCTVYNQTARTFSNYPLDLGEDAWDTDALVTATKMQSDGSDVHVFVDGAEVDYWLDGINTTTTKLWINISLQPQVALTVSGAHTNSVETITLENTSGNKEALTRLPNSGILLTPNNELIHFTTKNEGGLTLTCKRGCFDSTAGTISDTNTLYWVEHEIYVVYGDTSLTDYTVDDTRKPMFELASSTNISWDWDSFTVYDENAAPTVRAASWANSLVIASKVYPSAIYVDNQWAYYEAMATTNPNSQTDPSGRTFSVMGELLASNVAGAGQITADIYWDIYLPSGVTHIAADGNSYRANTWFSDGPDFDISLPTISWSTAFTVSSPGSSNTVTAWSQAALALGATYNRLRFHSAYSGINTIDIRFEVNNVTLTLDSTTIPYVAFVGEAQPYLFDATLTNVSTGDYLTISYAIPVDDTLEIDTENRTATHLEWGVNARGGILESSIRWDVLRLQFGGNTLQYDETGMVGVDLTTTWRDGNN